MTRLQTDPDGRGCGPRRRAALFAACLAMAGCGAPQFMVASREGTPTVMDIVDRINCELADLVRDDTDFGKHRQRFLAGDYHVAVAISLVVTETGELAPNFNVPVPPQFAFNVGMRLMRQREQTHMQNLYFSMTEIESRLRRAPQALRCPRDDGNLSGDLGIRQTALMGMGAPGSATAANIGPGLGGEFGGNVSFVLTRNINSVGPTWTLTHFRGPGSMGSLGRTDTNRVYFAFVSKAPATAPRTRDPAAPPSIRARDLLNQLLLNQLTLPTAR